ncbi:MAG: histidinol-phosphate transaminase [Candidatus Latescibacterota bacterium]|jgi:histidinol-phosphate aminotransferase
MNRPPVHLFRPAIAEMQAYVPGEQPEGGGFLKLNTNENPYPPAPRLVERVRAACGEELRLYPDPQARSLRRRLAEVFGVQPEQTMVGNGSDELLGIIMRSFVDPGDPVAYPHPTYSYYQQLVQTQAGRSIQVDYPEDYALPLEELAAQGAKVTLVVNPNAPSGTLVPLDRIAALASRVRGLLVVDEAYVDFSDGGAVPLLSGHPNLIVVRTMSKSFSLAGMRIGFAFAAPELMAGMAKVRDHYNVNRLSLLAAEAALDEIEVMRSQAARIRSSRTRLTAELRELGFQVWDSEANFVLCRRGSPTAATLYARLKERRILVRHFEQPRLQDCLRITVGTDEQCSTLIAAMREILAG